MRQSSSAYPARQLAEGDASDSVAGPYQETSQLPPAATRVSENYTVAWTAAKLADKERLGWPLSNSALHSRLARSSTPQWTILELPPGQELTRSDPW